MTYDARLGFDPELAMDQAAYQDPYAGQQVGPPPMQGPDYSEMVKSVGKTAVQTYLKKKAAAQAASSLGFGGSAAATGASVGPTVAAASPYAAMPGAEAFAAGSTLSGTSTGAAAATPVALPAAVAIATALEGRSALRMATGKSKNWKQASVADNAGRALLAMSTFGGSEAANYLKNNLIGRHRTTRQLAKGNTSELRKSGADDATWQDYVSGMRDQYASAPTGKAFAGKYDSFDEYKKGGLEAGDLTGVLGNLRLGPEYGKLSFDKQKQFTQSLIDSDQYFSKKGEVDVKDLELAKKKLAEAIKKK